MNYNKTKTNNEYFTVKDAIELSFGIIAFIIVGLIYFSF